MFSFAGVLNFLLNLLNVVVPLIGLVVIATKASGSAKKLGIAGCAILAGQGVLQTVWFFVGPRLVRGTGSSIAVLYGVVGVVLTIIGAIGLMIVIAAVVAGRGQPPAAPYGQQPPSNPYQQYPPR